MRHQITKLTKGHSTKAERRFVELLKKNRIPFRAKIRIAGKETDFIIGRYVIEIDGHLQDVEKNRAIIEKGYSPIHLDNANIGPHLEEWLRKIWQQEQGFLPHTERR